MDIKNLQDMIDDIKTKISDNEYKNISENLQKLFIKESKDLYKVNLYYPYLSINVCNNETDDLTTINNLEIKEIEFITTINDDVNNCVIFSKLLDELKTNTLVKCGRYIHHIFDYVPLEFKSNNDYIFTNSNENQNVIFNINSVIDNVLVKIIKI